MWAEEVGSQFETLRAKLAKNIKDACNEFLSSPDWAKNMEIIDDLNRNTHLSGFVVQEIRQQLTSTNPEIELLALTLVEGVAKNCPCSHGAIANPTFMRCLVALALDQRKEGFLKKLGFKKETVINKEYVKSQTTDKALLLLRMLSDAYKDTSLYPIFYKTYAELLKKGIRFPEPTKDEDVKIFSQTQPKSSQGTFSGMGSIPKTNSSKVITVDRSLPMIQPVIKLTDVTNIALMQAQDTAAFLFDVLNTSEVGQNLQAPGVILDMVAAAKAEQINVQTIAANPNTQEADLMQALAINEILLQVIADYGALASGKKRQYEEELNVAQMVEDADKQESKNEEEEVNNEVIPLALDPPPSEAPASRRELTNKKKSKPNVLGSKDIETSLKNEKEKEKEKAGDEDDIFAFLNQSSGKPVATTAPKQSLDPLDFLNDSTSSSKTQPSSVNTNSSSNQAKTSVGKAPELGNKQLSSGGSNKAVEIDSFFSTSTKTDNSSQKQKPLSKPINNDPFQQNSSSLNSKGNKEAEIDPFDTLEDPFSSMGSIKPTNPAVNPFSAMATNKESTDNGEDFDTGDPFAAFQ